MGTLEKPFPVITMSTKDVVTGPVRTARAWGSSAGESNSGEREQVLSVFLALRVVAPSTWMSNASREWGDAPVYSDL